MVPVRKRLHVQLSQIQEIVDALELEGVAIDLICPAALLALSNIQDEIRGSDLLIWDHENSRHVFALGNGHVQDWHLLTLELRELDLKLALRAVSATEPLCLMVYSGDEDLRDRLSEMPDVQVRGFEHRDLLKAATPTCVTFLRGKQPSFINLRRDALAAADAHRHIRVPLSATLTSCVLFLVVVTLVMLHRAQSYNQITQRLEADQRLVFHRLWPGQAAPTSIKSRLASEESRLRGLSGDLEARSHGEADAIASALRKQGTFKIEGPRTEQLAGQGVSFTINASYSPLLRTEQIALQSHEK